MEITGLYNIIYYKRKKKESRLKYITIKGDILIREYTEEAKRNSSVSNRTCGHWPPHIIIYISYMSHGNPVLKHFCFKTQLQVKWYIKTCSHWSQSGLVGTSSIIILLLRCDVACAERIVILAGRRYTCALFGALQLTLVKIIRSVSCGTCMLWYK